MIPITYVNGDATVPVVENGVRVIPHICNDVSAWGAGFVMALSAKWKSPEESYRSVRKSHLHQGLVQMVPVADGIIVANMVAQNGTVSAENLTPINYASLDRTLSQVADYAKDNPTISIHMPRIGCGLAGGKWDTVEQLVILWLCSEDIPVYVYDF